MAERVSRLSRRGRSPTLSTYYYTRVSRNFSSCLIMLILYLWIFAEICGLLSLVTTFWMCGARYVYIVSTTIYTYINIIYISIYIYIIIVPLYSLYKLHIHRPERERERERETLLLSSELWYRVSSLLAITRTMTMTMMIITMTMIWCWDKLSIFYIASPSINLGLF